MLKEVKVRCAFICFFIPAFASKVLGQPLVLHLIDHYCFPGTSTNSQGHERSESTSSSLSFRQPDIRYVEAVHEIITNESFGFTQEYPRGPLHKPNAPVTRSAVTIIGHFEPRNQLDLQCR